MPTNKNALIRYIVMDQCFQHPYKKFFINELAELCTKEVESYLGKAINGISTRTILNDINFMRSESGYNAPIESLYFGKKAYYRYKDLNFSIKKMPLNQQHIVALKEAILVFSSISGRNEFSFIDELMPKFFSVGDIYQNNKVIISYQENPQLRNRHGIAVIFNYIRYGQSLSISYKPFFDNELQIYSFHPWHLKQYNNRWFLLGFTKDKNLGHLNPINLAVDRILSMEESRESYIENNKINFDTYFDDIIGVSKPINGNIEKIILHLNQSVVPYIETKPLHHTQSKVIKIEHELYETSINVIPNYELFSTLYSFGNQIKLVSPDLLASIYDQRGFLDYHSIY